MDNFVVTFLFLLCLAGVDVTFQARVLSSSPGSMGPGGGRITIKGLDFSEDQFNYETEDSYKGNRVVLYDRTTSTTKECEVLQFECSSYQIVCEMRPIDVLWTTAFRVVVYVDGVKASHHGMIWISPVAGPIIRDVSPISGPPGSIVTFRGSLYANRYEQTSTDKDSVLLEGIRFGPRECEVMIDGKVKISPEEIRCKSKGTYVGNYDATIFVEPPYGTSAIDANAYKVSVKDEFYLYQAYPVINSVNPNTGSLEGGTRLTLNGLGFDPKLGKTFVHVAGEACDIESISSKTITCITPGKYQKNHNVGGRGLLYEQWRTTYVSDLADVDQLTSMAEDHVSRIVDGAVVDHVNSTMFTGRLSGYFICPHDGHFQFRVQADGDAHLYLSPSKDPARKVLISNGDWSHRVYLSTSQLYFIEAVHRQGETFGGRMSINLFQHETPLSNRLFSGITAELQTISYRLFVSSDKRRRETQELDFSNIVSKSLIQLYYKGQTSHTFTYDPAGSHNYQRIYRALVSMLFPSCTFHSGGSVGLSVDFEDSSSEPSSGSFCGMKVARSSSPLSALIETVNIHLNRHPYMCFAARTEYLNGLYTITYTTSSGTSSERTFKIPSFRRTSSWIYQCINVLLDFPLREKRTEITVTDVKFHDYGIDALIDSISFSSLPTKVIRKVANNTDLERISVEKTSSHVYRIKYYSMSRKEMFHLMGAAESGIPLPEHQLEGVTSQSSVTFSISGQEVVVKRLVSGVLGPRGTWGISMYNRTASGIPLAASELQIKEAMDKLLELPIKGVGRRSKSFEEYYSIYFPAGSNYPELQIDKSQIQYEGSIGFTVKTLVDGGLKMDYIGGDFFRIHKAGRPVTVTVNKITAACHTETACEFTHSSEVTPAVTQVKTAYKQDEATLTITGSKFSEISSNNEVTVGTTTCVVFSSLTNEIKCNVPTIVAGNHTITVTVLPLGRAETTPSPLIYVQPLKTTSISPTVGSYEGGTTIIISGKGFPENLENWQNANTQVLFGDIPCTVTSTTQQGLVCVTGAKGSPGSVEVIVTVNGVKASTPNQFEYSSSVTAVVSSVSPITSAISGGATATITGNGFGDGVSGKVTVNEKDCYVKMWSDTEITCVLPDSTPGIFPVRVLVASLGYADTSGASPITYEFSITSMTPASASLLGGTTVILTGVGFGEDCMDISVQFSDEYVCDVTECTSTSITCTTRKLTQIHQVINNGTHRTYGLGFEWIPEQISIEAGDYINWMWDTPLASDVRIGVYQAKSNKYYTHYDVRGFSSGAPSSSGSFLHRFPALGYYYYSGPQVFPRHEHYMTGLINVLLPENKELPVVVQKYGLTAMHETNSGHSAGILGDALCSTTPETYQECDDIDAEAQDSSFFYMSFQTCSTPSIYSIEVEVEETPVRADTEKPYLLGHYGDKLVIKGEGFGDRPCQNTVKMGDNEHCQVTESTFTSITCTLSAQLHSFRQYPISLSVFNRGLVLPAQSAAPSLNFVLFPKVASISPAKGSIAGGFSLHIHGTGFAPFSDNILTEVNIGATPCLVKSVTFSEIVCIGGASLPMNENVVQVVIGGEIPSFDAEQIFDYISDGVADVTDIQPTMLGVDSMITIQGKNFGNDPSKVKVFLREAIFSKRSLEIEDEPVKDPVVTTRRIERNRKSPFLHADSAQSWMIAGSDRDEHRVVRRSISEENEEIKERLREIMIESNAVGKDAWGNDRGVHIEEPKGNNKRVFRRQIRTLKSAELEKKNMKDVDTEGLTWGLAYKDSEDFNGYHFDENKKAIEKDGNEFESFKENAPYDFEETERGKRNGTLLSKSKKSKDTLEAEIDEESVWNEMVYDGGDSWKDEELKTKEKRNVQEPEEFECTVITASENSISCQVKGAPAGVYHVVVKTSLGDALSTLDVDVPVHVFSVSPSSGSVHGGSLLTIRGSGFDSDVQVNIGESVCEVQVNETDKVICMTSEGTSGTHPLRVVARGRENTDQSFTYDRAITPHINTINSDSAEPGETIEIIGRNFGNSGEVRLGSSDCVILSYTDSVIDCQVPGVSGDIYKLQVSVAGTGFSNAKDFMVPLAATDVSPTSGSSGGGTMITLSGSGFSTDGDAVITVCGKVCRVEGQVLQNSISCRVPATSSIGRKDCTVKITQGSGIEVALTSAWSYLPNLTPDIRLVTPKRGGTAGGTKIVITGTGFAESGNKVSINGTECIIKTESETAITCETEPHRGNIKTAVTVDVPGKGYATTDDNAEFYYIDRWSSVFTWGGHRLPGEKQYVVIPKDMTILIDVDTPILSFLLIDGGHVIFDDEQPDLTLNSEYILILKGGSLSIGSEQQPYQNLATINLYGHVQSTPLPVYGAKVLAVREGNLDLHGRPISVTWTRLSETAEKGSHQIKLMQSVDWKAGDQIVIATTGGRTSMKETETMFISSVSEDGLTLTLEQPLEYTHLSIVQVLANTTVETRGEVGLLTRNIKVQGNVNQEFLYTIPACEKGFNPGQFAAQTCFHGKFGEEIGSDQFGATIMLSAAAMDSKAVTGRIEYVEVTFAGQGFRLGRYPIHFHMSGDVTGNYVRGCSIHNTFNRAVTIHGVHNLLVENNVVYNIMGHAIFTEDGIETFNVIQSNLVVFARPSSSLLNADLTPAAYWIVNPLNIVRHNAAAGCSHFGFWYRIDSFPSGPSSKRHHVCISNLPLKEFNNNTAHSIGRYGLWVFSGKTAWTPKRFTKMDRMCSRYNYPETADFNNFLAWKCERGAEAVAGEYIVFNRFIVLDNSAAGIEMVVMKGSWGSNGPGIKDSLVIGGSALSDGKCSTDRGIVIPRKELYNVDGVTFVNFNGRGCVAIGGCSQCDSFMGGYPAQFRGLQFINSENIVGWKWRHEHWFIDVDGSLTGKAPETKVIPQNAMLPPTLCTFNVPEFSFSPHTPGAVCDPSISFHGMAITQVIPASLTYLPLTITTDYGSSVVEFKFMALIRLASWEAIVLDGYRHQLSFVGAEHITNVSYSIILLNMKPGDSVMFSQKLSEKPDKVKVKGKKGQEVEDGVLRDNGDWTWNEDEKMLTYMVTDGSRQTKRDLFQSRPVGEKVETSFKAFRCSLAYCGAIQEPPFLLGQAQMKKMWSNDHTWRHIPKGYAGHGGVQPAEGEDLLIPSALWVIADVQMPSFGKVYIDGILEIEDSRDNVLNATNIIIRNGKLIAGKQSLDIYSGQSQLFTHKFTILLRGNHNSSGGMNVGAKSLAVFGTLDLHGADVGVTWTKLKITAEVGSTTIKLMQSVDWSNGQEIVITTTSYEAAETEKRRIVARSHNGKTLTLDEPLKYEHLGVRRTTSDGTTSYDMRAEVGLLTRNIRIEGQGYEGMEVYRFGGRVMVAEHQTDTEHFVGTAKLSNVEFYNMGQAFYTNLNNPGYSLSFINIGDSFSSVTKCSFNHNFMTAIYVHRSNDIIFDKNIVYHTVDTSIKDAGSRNSWVDNLVTVTLFSGTYLGDDNTANDGWNPSFSFTSAHAPFVVGNVVAGSERSAFRTRGESCGSSPSLFHNNEAHGMLHGITKMKQESTDGCSRFSGYYLWRAYDYGVYVNAYDSIQMDNMVLAECNVGFLPMIVGPKLPSHRYLNQFVKITDSVVIGRSSIYTCNNLKAPKIAAFQPVQRAQRTPSGGISGINWACFMTQFLRAPKSGRFSNPMSYPTLYGATYLVNVTFVGFGKVCGSAVDAAIIPNVFCEDVNHPIINKNAQFKDVHEGSRVFMHRPVLGSVSPADCVDMDCDGFKKTIIRDTDGSIIGDGIPGTIVPQSDYEWDGDVRRGLGDYRIPTTVLTTPTGRKIPKDLKAKYNGIYGTNNCTWIEGWQMYTCHGIQHRMLIIESMDPDTEDRRLSPVALVVDPGTEGYIDLINGPQDHSWCFGYNCQKRVSTFYTIAALGLVHEISFTSTPPETMRLHLRSDDDDQGILVNIFFLKSQRYNVYVDGRYVSPTNADFSTGKMVLRPPKDYENPEEYIPGLQSHNHGSNYYDRYNKLLWIVLKGSEPIDVLMEPVFSVRFGTFVDVDTFYEKNVVDNIAYLLNIPVEFIMTMDVIRESRHKRSADGSQTNYVEMEVEVSGGQALASIHGNGSTFNQIIGNKLTKTNKELADLVNCYQSKELSKRLNSTIVKFEVDKPPLPPNQPIPVPDKETAESVTGSLYSASKQRQDLDKLTNELKPIRYEVVYDMQVTVQPGGNNKDHIPLQVQPVISITDKQGSPIQEVGVEEQPWRVRATLQNSTAQLEGDPIVNIHQGVARFTNLAVSHPGDNYVLHFDVVSPKDVPLEATSNVFVVTSNELTLKVIQPYSVLKKRKFDPPIQVLIWDSVADQETTEEQQPYKWECELRERISNMYTGLEGHLEGEIKVNINPSFTRAVFDNVAIDELGRMYMLSVFCTQNTPTPRVHTYNLDGISVKESEDVSRMDTFHMILKGNVDTRLEEDEVEFSVALANAVFDYPVEVTLRDIHIDFSDSSQLDVETSVFGTPSATNLMFSYLEDKVKSGNVEFEFKKRLFTVESFRKASREENQGP